MSILANKVSSDVIDVQVSDTELVLRLSDGRTVSAPWLGFHAFCTEQRSSATIGGSSAKASASTGRIWMKTSRYAACWLRLDRMLSCKMIGLGSTASPVPRWSIPKHKQKGSKAIVALNFRIWKLPKSLAALAGVGSITWIKPTLEPVKLALMKTELEGRVDRRLLSRV
jgi:hypothetical protein